MSNKVDLSVCGMEFLVQSDDDEKYVKAIGSILNQRMNSILQGNPHLTVAMVAVLAALENADSAQKSRADAENLRVQLKGYIEELNKMRMSRDEAQREVKRLERLLKPTDDKPNLKR